jgi:hypothetical protein
MSAPDPAIATRFGEIRWSYADRDQDALTELRGRLAATGRREDLIDYSALVRGVVFHIATVNSGRPYTIDTQEWQDLDRDLIGDFLGFLSQESYERYGFFISALAVSKSDRTPSEGFWSLMKRLGLVASGRGDRALKFWLGQVRAAHEWYVANPDRDV